MTELIKNRWSYFIFRLFSFIVIFLVCLYISVISLSAEATEANVCRTPKAEDNGKTTFCFFSLNNPKEFHKLEDKYKGVKGVEIKEFYGENSASQSVEKKFKNMLKNNECDSLVISGHHTGYFAGKQSISKNNDSQTLDLDFMEELSCEEGCDEWFSNVKSLFLMGCQTVKTPDNLKEGSHRPADAATIRISSEGEVTSNYIHRSVNQAYSSTLDQNNKLSHRYLRMFPNSSLYGWGKSAPSKLSERSLPDFIDLVGELQGEDKKVNQSSEENDILQFIKFMNQSDRTNKCLVADKWTKHWTSRDPTVVTDQEVFDDTQATACYLKDQTQFVNNQKLGCNLTKALKSNNGDEIKEAINKILTAGTPDEEVSREAIRANFNRLMSLITNEGSKEQDWYNEVVEQLKNSEILQSAVTAEIMPPAGNTQPNKVGFVRKSDYLYFYREMGWSDNNKDKKISTSFLNQLQTAFKDMKNKNNSNEDVTKTFHFFLLQSITNNDLQKWLYENNSKEFKSLLKQYDEIYSASQDEVYESYINGEIQYLKESI